MSDLEARTARLVDLADTASDAVRAINHATIVAPPLPAPSVYDVIGSLTGVGYGLDQAAAQLADRLDASAAVFDLYECDGGDPEESIAAARRALTAAAEHARLLGTLLDRAQSAIAGQGYNT